MNVEETEYIADQLVNYALVLAATASTIVDMGKEGQIARRHLAAECRELRRMAKKLREAPVTPP